jgi:very-short-patch-repair endonuclease
MRWWTIAQAQAGTVSARQLGSGGLSSSTVHRMAATGELTRMSHGVYLVGGAPRSWQARLWAALLATDGVLCLTSAGRLWGIWDEPDDEVHVAIAARRRATAVPGVVIHRQGVPPGAVRTRSGLAVTSRSWTALDLLAHASPTEAMRFADRALQRGWLTKDQLAARLRDQPNRPGNGALRRLQRTFGDGAAAQSERVLHQLLRRAGIRDWRPNHEVWSAGELLAVVDVALPHRMVAIEVDGMAYHVDVDRFRRDRSRQNALVALGWTVLRFTWSDLVDRPGYVVAMISRLAA